MELYDVIVVYYTQEEADRIEKVQLSAARIACGIKKETSHGEIYGETKWESVESRRKRQRLIMLCI